MKRATDAGVSETAYRRSASSIVARDEMEAQLLAEVVDKPSEQRRTVEIALEDNSGGPIAPGAVLVKHLLYSPKDDPGGAAALARRRPGLGGRRGRGERRPTTTLKAGTTRFVDLAPGERRRHLGRRERLPALLRQGRSADPAGPGVRRRDLRRGPHARPAARAGQVGLRLARHRVRHGRRSRSSAPRS